MADERSTLPDARAVALVEMACDLARDEDALLANARENAAEFERNFDPPTLAAARAAYARRLQALRGDQR